MKSYFNTSKVRLEVVEGVARITTTPLFQYLKGAIGRIDRAEQKVIDRYISIPQRCDWKPVVHERPLHLARISIPQRCDWKPGRRSFKAPLSSAERQFAARSSGHNIVIRRFRVNP